MATDTINQISTGAFRRIARVTKRVEAMLHLPTDEQTDPGSDVVDVPKDHWFTTVLQAILPGGLLRVRMVAVKDDGTLVGDGSGSPVETENCRPASGVSGRVAMPTASSGLGAVVHMPGFFPVLLQLSTTTPDPGSGDGDAYSGDTTNNCSFKYTIKDLAGNVIQGDGVESGGVATEIEPDWRPQLPGKLLSGHAKVGLAYFKADGTLGLWSACEIIDAEAC